MLKRNNLRHKYIEPRLRIYVGDKHDHLAQLPPDVKPLPRVPESLRKHASANFHFGLGSGNQAQYSPKKM
jgi:hypothetical protein